MPLRLASAVALAVGLLVPGIAGAQTANGSPTAPASPGLVGTPRPVSRTAPTVGSRRANSSAKLSADGLQASPKPSAADRAEQKKLDHDLHICIGC